MCLACSVRTISIREIEVNSPELLFQEARRSMLVLRKDDQRWRIYGALAHITHTWDGGLMKMEPIAR